MITYAPLWETMKTRGITTYYLINKCGFSSNTIYSLKHNKGISTLIINDLCNVLDCNVSEVLLFTRDPEPYRKSAGRKQN